jgi:hypothetical protein
MSIRSCSSCGVDDGVYHMTITVDVIGGSAVNPRRKTVQFWLCSACESKSCDVLARDSKQKERVASIMTQELDNNLYANWKTDWRCYGK